MAWQNNTWPHWSLVSIQLSWESSWATSDTGNKTRSVVQSIRKRNFGKYMYVYQPQQPGVWLRWDCKGGWGYCPEKKADVSNWNICLFYPVLGPRRLNVINEATCCCWQQPHCSPSLVYYRPEHSGWRNHWTNSSQVLGWFQLMLLQIPILLTPQKICIWNKHTPRQIEKLL